MPKAVLDIFLDIFSAALLSAFTILLTLSKKDHRFAVALLSAAAFFYLTMGVSGYMAHTQKKSGA